MIAFTNAAVALVAMKGKELPPELMDEIRIGAGYAKFGTLGPDRYGCLWHLQPDMLGEYADNKAALIDLAEHKIAAHSLGENRRLGIVARKRHVQHIRRNWRVTLKELATVAVEKIITEDYCGVLDQHLDRLEFV